MKQPFVNATLADRRKPLENLAHRPSPHPLREEPLKPLGKLPVARVPAPPKKESAPSELDKMKAELAKMLAASEKPKVKAVPKSRLIRMSSSVEESPAASLKDYSDVLSMLLAKK